MQCMKRIQLALRIHPLYMEHMLKRSSHQLRQRRYQERKQCTPPVQVWRISLPRT